MGLVGDTLGPRGRRDTFDPDDAGVAVDETLLEPRMSVDIGSGILGGDLSAAVAKGGCAQGSGMRGARTGRISKATCVSSDGQGEWLLSGVGGCNSDAVSCSPTSDS